MTHIDPTVLDVSRAVSNLNGADRNEGQGIDDMRARLARNIAFQFEMAKLPRLAPDVDAINTVVAIMASHGARPTTIAEHSVAVTGLLVGAPS